jgi:hypothetical protein
VTELRSLGVTRDSIDVIKASEVLDVNCITKLKVPNFEELCIEEDDARKIKDTIHKFMREKTLETYNT